MLQTWTQQFNQIIQGLVRHWQITLVMIAILWAVFILNGILGGRLNGFGIRPRTTAGLPGIVFSPFLHGNFTHLLFNTLPLYILLNMMLVTGWSAWLHATLIIILGGGVLTWLFGRTAIHIGASGLIMGYWGYLLIHAFTHMSLMTIVLAIICVYYFGAMYLNLFPSDKKTSWEAHLFGAIAGIFAAVI